MHAVNITSIIFWISLPTVMFGGYSALMFLRGKLSPFQEKFFKLGHAHAGTLLTLGLVYSYYIAQTNISGDIGLSLFGAGVILQSGGFFWHAYLDNEGKRKTGMYITSVGALLLILAVIWLVIGLFGVL